MKLEELAQKVLTYADGNGAGDQPLVTNCSSLQVVRQRVPTEIYPVLYQPIFCLVLQGEKTTWFGSEAVSFGKMQSLIVGLDLPTQARVSKASRTEPYLALALILDLAQIRELALELGSEKEQAESRSAVAAASADEAVLDAMGRLFALTERPEALNILAPLIIKEIHYWLLKAKHGAILRQLSTRDSQAARVAQAITHIRRDVAASLKVEDLAQLAGMSPSSFHGHFKAFTGITPMQFQKRLRLMEARRLIQLEGVSISASAFQVGYESSSQFSREYSRQFGQPPRQDQADAKAFISGRI
ncbi:AraC family transcriptional regulator [Roseibium limicola]|uniref:AraC family transcriptional regulator n=1 Tax=Roseibium limicola TaxID=2816037 RepID=A0A939EKQ8_9HYPH|nr:AraC family transcriptional regulator [Roseibium limicola]MBO0343651.1 AraC family transcriptional regulator [Roseibium limicola]